jgi:hypothetical protein
MDTLAAPEITGRELTGKVFALATPIAKGASSAAVHAEALAIVHAVLPNLAEPDADRAAHLLAWAAYLQNTATLKEAHFQRKLSKLFEETSDQLSVGDRLNLNNGSWRDSTATPRPPECQYVVIGVFIKLVHWHESGPPDVIAAAPGEELPDPRDLNAQIPEAEWSIDLSGKPRPPWVRWRVIALLDAVNAALFSYGNSTVGMTVAFEQLQQRIEIMNALRGGEVMAVVQLRDAPMKTQFGDRRRPHFEIVGWRRFDTGGALRIFDQSTTALQVVATPTLEEEARDKVPY